MGVIQATLTMPGIAGMVLTMGMAVDTNVLIFERIREELKINSTVQYAIKRGFEQAFATILDSNLTTLIAAFFFICVLIFALWYFIDWKLDILYYKKVREDERMKDLTLKQLLKLSDMITKHLESEERKSSALLMELKKRSK